MDIEEGSSTGSSLVSADEYANADLGIIGRNYLVFETVQFDEVRAPIVIQRTIFVCDDRIQCGYVKEKKHNICTFEGNGTIMRWILSRWR